MKNGKFSLGWYYFALCGGLVSGLLFSRAQYHKGQADAYGKIADDLSKISEETEKWLEEHKNNEVEES